MNKSSIKTSIQIIHNPISLIRLKETFKTKTENKPQGGTTLFGRYGYVLQNRVWIWRFLVFRV